MDKNQRIKVAVKWLIAGGIAKNQEKLGKILGYGNKSSFSQVLNAKVSIPDDFIDRLCALDSRLNEEWLNTGRGDMIKISGNTQNVRGGDGSFIQSAQGNDISLTANESHSKYKTAEEYEREIAYLKQLVKEKDERILLLNRLVNKD